MKSRYVTGVVKNPSAGSYGYLWSAWSAYYVIPNIYEGRLYINDEFLPILLNAKNQEIPIGVYKKGGRINTAGGFEV